MVKHNEGVFCVYKVNKNGKCNELKMDFYDFEYELACNIDKRFLSGTEDKNLKEFCVDEKLFDHLFDTIEKYFDHGSEYTEKRSYQELIETEKKLAEEEKKKTLVDKETIKKALRLELPKEEIARLATYDLAYEKGDYYDFELIEKTILKYTSFEIDEDVFADWCWINMRVFISEYSGEDRELKKLYYSLGNTFDAWLFNPGREGEALQECYDSLSYIRFVDHLIKNAGRKRKKDYEKNGIIIYYAFETRIGNGFVYKVFIVDKKRKRANLKFVYEPRYKDLHLTYASKRDFDRAVSRFFENYNFDATLSEYDQLTKKR